MGMSQEVLSISDPTTPCSLSLGKRPRGRTPKNKQATKSLPDTPPITPAILSNRGRLDIPSSSKRSHLVIDNDLTFDDPTPRKRGKAAAKDKVDFMSIWEQDTLGQREKYTAAQLKYKALADPALLMRQAREKDKDRMLELQKTQNERSLILIRQYEIAASMNKPIEELFPGALAASVVVTADVLKAPPAPKQKGPLSGVLPQ
ncbi:hypothetical protein EV426DRAFT_645764 [Tirmania nivea]|nr:hypothetical protein EV426DRAFT_645764 [Tirmania nivea]